MTNLTPILIPLIQAIVIVGVIIWYSRTRRKAKDKPEQWGDDKE